ncbi:MAG: transglutaminase family protein [Polaromonas sp.]
MLKLALPTFPALRNLPRDTRDTLFLLGVIAWVLVPQLGRLPWWCSALAIGVLLWRGWLAVQARPLPGKWWLAGLLVLTIGATLWTNRTLLGREAGVTLIVVLLALKTLELRARRDAFVVFFLGFFTMLTSFFQSQSLLTAAAMLLGLLGLLTALVNAHMPVGRPSLLLAARTAGGMALLGAPIMLVMFMLFPRMAPLWGIPADAMSGRSGLSSSMRVGNLAKLALDESIAMRIRFEGPPPPQSDLYFRGPVLSTFDGREWRPLESTSIGRLDSASDLEVSGTPVRYQVTMEPNNRPWLLLLDATPRAPDVPGMKAAMTSELQWFVNRPLTDITRYQVESYTAFRHGARQQASSLRDYLALPPGFNPRTLQLAADMRRDPRYARADAATLVNAVMDRLRTGGYTYTLEPGVTGQHSADEFWFDTKLGFCEHIASAFVVLMRALDVPARIVTGYQGGERNKVDGYWTVRQSDAHAWVEVWQSGSGWMRVDPTSAVAPGRTGAFQRLRSPPGPVAAAFSGALGTFSPTLLASLRASWEALNNGWNQRVLNYTQSRQLDLLKTLGFTSPSREDLSYVLIALVVAVSLLGAAWTLWERTQHDPWLRLLARARKRLARGGIDSTAATSPRQLARQVLAKYGGESGSQGQALHDWLMALELQRYASSSASQQLALAQLKQQLRRLAWPA